MASCTRLGLMIPAGEYQAWGRLGPIKNKSPGRAPIVIAPDAGRGSAWAPDGTIIFARVGVGLVRVSSDGGILETLTTPDRESREKTHRHPNLLPGGNALLFTHGSADIDSFDEASIAVLSLETVVLP